MHLLGRSPGTLIVLDIPPPVLGQVAVDVRPTNVDKVRPQAAHQIFAYVGQQLGGGGPKAEHDDVGIADPRPGGNPRSEQTEVLLVVRR